MQFWEIIAFVMDKLHSALPHVITFLLIHSSCNYFLNCTQIHVITYTNSLGQLKCTKSCIEVAKSQGQSLFSGLDYWTGLLDWTLIFLSLRMPSIRIIGYTLRVNSMQRFNNLRCSWVYHVSEWNVHFSNCC